MNIFATDDDPAAAARGLDDKRVVKLTLECTQMLSAAVAARVSAEDFDRHAGEGRLMRPTHANHPVTLWVGRTQSNWVWTFRHAIALAGEYQTAYGRQHACMTNLRYMHEARVYSCIAPGPLEEFQNSARNGELDMSWIDPPTEAYRAYLQARWRGDTRSVTFRNRRPPEWADLSLIQEFAE